MATYTRYPAVASKSWKSPVANLAALPSTGNTTGDTRVTIDSDKIYIWNGSSWVPASASVTPGGSNGSIQYNDSGALGGDGNFRWDGSNVLNLSGDYVLSALNAINFDNDSNNFYAGLNAGSLILSNLTNALEITYGPNAGDGIAFGATGFDVALELDIYQNAHFYNDIFVTNYIRSLDLQVSINPGERKLYDSGSGQAGNWDQRALYNSSGDTTLRWQDMQLLVNGDSSIDWYNRSFYDTDSNVVIDYQNGYIYHPDVGFGRVAVVDGLNACLRNPNSGDTVFDFGNQQLYDGSATVAIDVRDRALFNSSNQDVLEWGNLDGNGDPVARVQNFAFTGNGTMWFNDSSDTNWRLGLNLSTLPFTPVYITNANLSFVVSGQAGQGFAVGSSTGSAFEIDSFTNICYANKLAVTNKATSYNGITLAGQGLVPVVATIDLTNQASSIGATTLYASTTAAMYQVDIYILTTTTAAAGTVSCSIAWTDNVTSRTVTTSTILLTGNNYLSQSVIVKVNASTNITYATTVAAVTGSPKYELAIVARKLT